MSALAALSVEPSAHLEFGPGCVALLPEAVTAVGPARALLITDAGLRRAGLVDRVTELLDESGIETRIFEGVEPNPSAGTLDVAARQARGFPDAVVVAVGGGSVLDAAKVIALLANNAGSARRYDYRAVPASPGRPVVAVPTTSGTGAETNGFGVIEDPGGAGKVYLGHASVRPARVLLDPELTVGVPPLVTAATGMDALIHGLESLASSGSNPLSQAYAAQAVTLVHGSLADAVEDGTDLDARARLMLGSHLAGRALFLSGLGLVHGIAHAVTHRCGAAHGQALCAVVAEVMAATADVAGPAYSTAARAMGLAGDTEADRVDAAVAEVRALADRVGARVTLGALGVTEEAVAQIAAAALADAVSANHPREFTPAQVAAIVRERL